MIIKGMHRYNIKMFQKVIVFATFFECMIGIGISFVSELVAEMQKY